MMEFTGDFRDLDELAEVAVELSDQAARQFEFRLSHEKFRAAQSWQGPSRGGVPAALRWYIKFDDSTLKEYAGQLDYFGIEPGAYFAPDSSGGPRLVYLSNVSTGRPTVREMVKGADNRLHMCWRGDWRGELDQILFRIVDVDVSDAILLLFIPAETERYLATIEREYRHKPVHEIRRTYFKTESFESGFRFVVISQSYVR